VVPCCYDKNAGHSMGNLNNLTFSNIWFGERYTAFRNIVIRSRKEIAMCRNCPEGTRIYY